jgi:hypothetical protein
MCFVILIVVSIVGTLRFLVVIAAQAFSQPRTDLLNAREKLVVGGFSPSVFATVDKLSPNVIGCFIFLFLGVTNNIILVELTRSMSNG